MPVGDAIAPLHTLSPGGGVRGVGSVAANPLGPTVYVQTDRMTFDLAWLVMCYWPIVLLVIVTLLGLFIAWRSWAIVRRPRRAGAPHCRRCNYELSGLALGEHADGSLPECPECGRGLTRGAVVMGRATKRRLAPLLIPGGVGVGVIVLGLLMLFGVWDPPLPGCSAPGLYRVLKDLGLEPPRHTLMNEALVLEVDLATGVELRTVVSEWGGAPTPIAVTPAGDAVITCQASAFTRYSTKDGRWLNSVNVIELAGLSTAGGIGGMSIGEPRAVLGFSRDGTAAFVVDTMAMGSPLTIPVWRWDLATGATSTAATVPTVGTRGATMTPSLMLAGDRVVSYPSNRFFPSPYSSLAVYPLAGEVIRTLNLGKYSPELEQPASTRDGATLFLAGGVGVATIDVATMTPTWFALPGAGLVGEYLALDGQDRLLAVDVRGARNTIELYDTSAMAWVGSLRAPLGRLPVQIAFSADGRYVVAVADSGGGTGRVMHIWDIKPIRDGLGPARPPAGSSPATPSP